MATPIIGAVVNANYGIEASWGVPVATGKSFGADVKLTNISIDNVVTPKGGIGNTFPQANIAGAYTANFSLEFDLTQDGQSINWIQSILGAPSSGTTELGTYGDPASTNANAPKSLTIAVVANTDTADATGEWVYEFFGCYCSSARFEASMNEAIHVSADFVAAGARINEAKSVDYATMAVSSKSVFTFAQAVLTGASISANVVDRMTITIGRECTVKHGIGSRLPQAIVPGLMSYSMESTIMYEVGKNILKMSMGTSTSTGTGATYATANPQALTDLALVLTVNGGSGNKQITFTGATMYVSKNNLNADINDAVMMDVSCQGTSVKVVMAAGS